MAMLQIGRVAFETSGPHYDKLSHHLKATWARQKRFGRRDALQFTGLAEEPVDVSGTIYPDYYGGFSSLASLRAMMSKPQMVVSGAGDVMGLWVILEVGSEQTYQDPAGRPRKVTFSVKLDRYGEDGASGLGLGQIAGALAGLSVGGILSGFPGVSLAAFSGGIGLNVGIGAGGISAGIDIGQLAGGAIGVDVGSAAALSGAVQGAGAAAAAAAQSVLRLW